MVVNRFQQGGVTLSNIHANFFQNRIIIKFRLVNKNLRDPDGHGCLFKANRLGNIFHIRTGHNANGRILSTADRRLNGSERHIDQLQRCLRRVLGNLLQQRVRAVGQISFEKNPGEVNHLE